LDISPDMLAVAGQYAEELQFDVELRQGDIRSIPFDDSAFDLVTCIRFLNWIDFDGVRQCLAELTRVSRDKLLLGIRQKTPYGDLRPSRNDLVRLAHLLSRHSKRRARREGLIYHTRSQVRGLFAEFGLEIVDFRQTDGRWDGTDYLIYLLRRSRQ
jgi:SAM-dependent methyltransferase